MTNSSNWSLRLRELLQSQIKKLRQDERRLNCVFLALIVLIIVFLLLDGSQLVRETNVLTVMFSVVVYSMCIRRIRTELQAIVNLFSQENGNEVSIREQSKSKGVRTL